MYDRSDDNAPFCSTYDLRFWQRSRKSSSSEDYPQQGPKETPYPTPSPKYYKPDTPKPYDSSDSDDSDKCSYDYYGLYGCGKCCVKACGECEEDDCKERAKKAGLTEDDCCPHRIKDSGKYCEDVGSAPCIVDKP